MWNKDEIIGKHNEIEGAINAKVGKFIHDQHLETEGEAERLAGQARQKAGKLRRKAAAAAKQADKQQPIAGRQRACEEVIRP